MALPAPPARPRQPRGRGRAADRPRARRTARSSRGRRCAVRKDGSRLAVSVAMSPMRDVAGPRHRRLRDRARRLRAPALRAAAALPRPTTTRSPACPTATASRRSSSARSTTPSATRTGGALFLLDLDDFKRVNDALGHAAGDELIRSVAQALRARLRSTDILARLGGDELAVLVPVADAEQAEAAARNIVAAVRGHEADVAGQAIRVTTTLGGVRLADAGGAGGRAGARRRRAVRRQGRRPRPRGDLRPRARAARVASGGDWESRIDQALRHGRFELFLQPILDLNGDKRRAATRRCCACTDEDEVVLPGAFLPTAERSGPDPRHRPLGARVGDRPARASTPTSSSRSTSRPARSTTRI